MLSFLIPARQEEWLGRTIDSILCAVRGDVEIVAVLDGAWTDPPIPDHPQVRLVHLPQPIGQRAATNLAARIARGDYICKIDAHCTVAEGFDVEMVRAIDECGADTTVIPAMLNLHAFNWACRSCGAETYQGPMPVVCATCQGRGPFERVVYWDLNAGGVPGRAMRTEFWRFDHDLHFQYHGPVRTDQRKADVADVMSSIGACFVMRRDRFFVLGGLDEAHGSWGQYGTEIACKSWLSGGRQVVCRRTWFAHLFRTQGAGFGFPYSIKASEQESARQYSRRVWLNNLWRGQARPLSWLIDYFEPVRGWHAAGDPQESPDVRKKRLARLEAVRSAGAMFTAGAAAIALPIH